MTRTWITGPVRAAPVERPLVALVAVLAAAVVELVEAAKPHQ